MDIREYLQTKEKGFYRILCNSMTVERRKQFYNAINEWHESELKLLGIADVSVSLLANLLKYAVDETGRISGDHDGNAGILMTTDSYEKIASDFIASLQ